MYTTACSGTVTYPRSQHCCLLLMLPCNQALLNQALLNQALLNQALLDQALLNQALLDQALLDQALLNQALLNQALLNQALLEEGPTRQVCGSPCSGLECLPGPDATVLCVLHP